MKIYKYIHFLQCISCNTKEDLVPYLVEKKYRIVTSRDVLVTTTTTGIGRVVLPVCNRCLNEFKRLRINLKHAVEFRPEPLVYRHRVCINKIARSVILYNNWASMVILSSEAKAREIEYWDI